MNDIIPSFVKVVGQSIWTLAQDKWTTPEVEKRGKLAWDDTFNPCVQALGDRRGTVIDVGAFIGDSTAWFDGNWRVVAFEPQRDAFSCLSHNCPTATNFPFPVGNGEIISLQFGEGGNMGARRIRPEAGETCRTMRIDDLLLTDVAFIKIDVEGWEPRVLQGAKATLELCKPLVRVEFNKPALDRNGFTYDDISQYFKGWKGVELFRYGNEQWDTLFFPP